MNVVARTKPAAEVASEESKDEIGTSEGERWRRKATVDYARGSVRLEGFVMSSFAEEMNNRFIDGEISSEELTAALLSHHAL
jgi:hypothetical protein